MGIANINTLQNNISYQDYLTNYTDEYLLQSLANLGQRIGVPGDGITVNKFSICDIFADAVEEPEYVRASYEISTGNISFYIDGQTEPIEEYVNSSYIITDDELLNIVDTNNIYTVGGKINKIDDDNFFCVFETNPIENETKHSSIVSVYESEDKELHEGLLMSYKDSNHITTYTIEKNTDDDLYTVRQFKDIDTTVTECWNCISENIHEISSVEDVLISFGVGFEQSDVDNNVELDKDTKEFSGLGKIFNSNSIFIPAEYSWMDVIKEHYSNVKYNNADNNRSVKKEIVSEFVRTVIKEYNNLEGKETVDIIFPGDYVFVIYANANDSSQIYGSKDLMNCTFDTNSQYKIRNIIAESINDDVVKTIAYRFNIDYYNDSSIDSINFEKDIVYPFINEDRNWQIGNIDTGIKSKGDDAGKPNIIITYAKPNKDDNNSVESILYNAAHKDELTQLFNNYLQTLYFDYAAPKRKESSETTTYDLKNALPSGWNRTDAATQYIEDALIISLISVDFDPNARADLGTGYLCTLWRYDENLKPQLITKFDDGEGSNVALDISDMANLNNLIAYYLNVEYTPDRYAFDHLVFSGIATAYKQTVTNSEKIYPVFRNFNNTLFTSDASEGADPLMQIADYHNVLNFTPEFRNASDITINEGEITSIDTSPQIVKHFEIKDKDESNTSYYISCGAHYDDYAYEFIPNGKYDASSLSYLEAFPTIDLKEVFVRNSNTLNRLNIITMREYGDGVAPYYAYIGSAVNIRDNDSTIHLGTSYTNINIGTSTMTYTECINRFNTVDEFDVDIASTVFNGEVTHNASTYHCNNSVSWNKHAIDDVTAYTAIVTPIGKISNGFTEMFGYNEVTISGRFLSRDHTVNKYYITPEKLWNFIGINTPDYVKTPNDEYFSSEDNSYINIYTNLDKYINGPIAIGNPLSITLLYEPVGDGDTSGYEVTAYVNELYTSNTSIK